MRVGTQVRSAFDRSIAVNRVGDLLFYPLPGHAIANKRRRAIHRLDSANNVNTCAVFFASPR